MFLLFSSSFLLHSRRALRLGWRVDGDETRSARSDRPTDWPSARRLTDATSRADGHTSSHRHTDDTSLATDRTCASRMQSRSAWSLRSCVGGRSRLASERRGADTVTKPTNGADIALATAYRYRTVGAGAGGCIRRVHSHARRHAPHSTPMSDVGVGASAASSRLVGGGPSRLLRPPFGLSFDPRAASMHHAAAAFEPSFGGADDAAHHSRHISTGGVGALPPAPSDPRMVDCILVRHGESEGNIGRHNRH